MTRQLPLKWLEAGEAFPDVRLAWPPYSDAPGLLAAGGSLDTRTLINAYSNGIFPWYSAGQPILWWSTDPRMVLRTGDFKLHRSLKKTIQQFRTQPTCEIRVDSHFAAVIANCANARRSNQNGTWILPEMVEAYVALHQAGHAHSIETWINGDLVGGLYCVNVGGAVFGESMFAHRTDASKVALAALVALCRTHGVTHIDCQQNTRHLASLGAAEMPRTEFMAHVRRAIARPAPAWKFEPLYWEKIFDPCSF